nr:unnamed protein product [Callosobruchus analis]
MYLPLSIKGITSSIDNTTTQSLNMLFAQINHNNNTNNNNKTHPNKTLCHFGGKNSTRNKTQPLCYRLSFRLNQGRMRMRTRSR